MRWAAWGRFSFVSWETRTSWWAFGNCTFLTMFFWEVKFLNDIYFNQNDLKLLFLLESLTTELKSKMKSLANDLKEAIY